MNLVRVMEKVFVTYLIKSSTVNSFASTFNSKNQIRSLLIPSISLKNLKQTKKALTQRIKLKKSHKVLNLFRVNSF